MKKLLLSAMLFFSCCTFFTDKTTVNIKLNPKNSGWYFIKLIEDTTLRNTASINVEFNDTARFITIKINDIDKTLVNPFDYNGNSLSHRLQYFGVKETISNNAFLEFYNPTDEELVNIDKWNPTNKRAWEIWRIGEQTFKKYYKDTIRK
ncbi:hypothetical protein [Mucilaginibacter lappiensis]|uniref:hypothetical protein n=1 Tax=Mucilaginibacter lappiensis TaxID=354630 RepID=UPI003D23B085